MINKRVLAPIVALFLALFANKSLGCDIYITSKCPTPPAPTEHNANWTLYCNEVKEHIDCINKKLKTCKNIQEFGPALETIKWNIKVIIEQVNKISIKPYINFIRFNYLILKGRSHGCTDLVDKIKLPRIPRKKKPTDTTKTTTNSNQQMETEKAIVYIDPNCHKNLVDMYCERLDFNPNLAKYFYNNTLDETWAISMKLFAPLNDANCKKLSKHSQCLQTNFRSKCEQSMALAFIKVDKIMQNCLAKMKKLSANSSFIISTSSLYNLFSIFTAFLIINFYY